MTLRASRCPSRRAALSSLGDTLPCACRFPPSGPGHPAAGPWFVFRSPIPDDAAGRQAKPPKVPGQPAVPLPCSSTPAGPSTPGHCGMSAWPRHVHNEGSHEIQAFEAQSHGFRARCLRFVQRVATADAKLASGRWPSATGRDWLPAGLSRKVSDASHPLFPSFLVQGHAEFLTAI
jgi:hypothetical protein